MQLFRQSLRQSAAASEAAGKIAALVVVPTVHRAARRVKACWLGPSESDSHPERSATATKNKPFINIAVVVSRV